MNKTGPEINMAVSSLDVDQRKMVLDFHELLISLGCSVKITTMGKSIDDWKCEYSTKKPKRTLLIFRVKNKGWSVRCKLYHIDKYEEVVSICTERIKYLICKAPDCEMHGGRCLGPVTFSYDNNQYSKCRHSILFKDIEMDDCKSLYQLIQLESQYIE